MHWSPSLPRLVGLVWMLLALPPASLCHGQEMARILPSSGMTPEVLKEKRSAYRKVLAELAVKREALQLRYASSGAATRIQTIAEARSLLTKTLLTEIFPAWDGTAWDFNGISEVPGEGAIACGYFVTTTLRDVGFKLPRIKLAQQPSQTIIRSLCEDKTIRVFYEKPLDTISTYLEQHGPGIYIVGLDCHTGFVVHDGISMAFIHSSYFRPPRAVISEPLESDNPLKRSKYRMIGKLFGDELVRKWLSQESVVMKK
ncbi:MAG: hypothetical protein ACAH88_20155 [Roseimicrobium sp.]